MTAKILIVDDNIQNIEILSFKLHVKYYNVITAIDGYTAIDLAKKEQPDVILLDIMMPNLDGFEVCKILKNDIETSYIPIIFITALNDINERITGLECGANDFLTKPVNDRILYSRLQIILRLKLVTDELRLRMKVSAVYMDGMLEASIIEYANKFKDSKIVIISTNKINIRNFIDDIDGYYREVLVYPDLDFLQEYERESIDIFIVDVSDDFGSGCRVCSDIKKYVDIRITPVIAVVDELVDYIVDQLMLAEASEYIELQYTRPELIARINSHLRMQRYHYALRNEMQDDIAMSMIDHLTGLYNRRYLYTYLDNLINNAVKFQSTIDVGVFMVDVDNFKEVNDVYGHDVGDKLLKFISKKISENVFFRDLVVRFGGEELCILLHTNINFQSCYDVANRIRKVLENEIFHVSSEIKIKKTVSIGGCLFQIDQYTSMDNISEFLKYVDEELYKAKNSGKNRLFVMNKIQK